MSTTQSFDKKKTKFARTRKTSYACWELAVCLWIWYELWLPLGLVTAGMVRGSLPPLWTPLILLAVYKGMDSKKELNKNVHDTAKRLIVFKSRMQYLRFSMIPRVEEVELGKFMGWKVLFKSFVSRKVPSLPFFWVEMVVRPASSAGDPSFAKRYEDLLRRQLRYPSAEHEVNPADANTYIMRFEMSTPVDRVDVGPVHPELVP